MAGAAAAAAAAAADTGAASDPIVGTNAALHTAANMHIVTLAAAKAHKAAAADGSGADAGTSAGAAEDEDAPQHYADSSMRPLIQGPGSPARVVAGDRKWAGALDTVRLSSRRRPVLRACAGMDTMHMEMERQGDGSGGGGAPRSRPVSAAPRRVMLIEAHGQSGQGNEDNVDWV